ncbi:hypothetical protein BKA62DRAFT_733266 [Auriculariales sp. MPI-PUGE-AT-0066]|nr:hypothetical protein BKA62DRAFT_733266 [Auriculariales sp. MPI-PUGE-AT-0066]
MARAEIQGEDPDPDSHGRWPSAQTNGHEKHYKSQRRECNSPPAPRCKPLLLPDEILSELFHTAIACRMADMSLGRGRRTGKLRTWSLFSRQSAEIARCNASMCRLGRLRRSDAGVVRKLRRSPWWWEKPCSSRCRPGSQLACLRVSVARVFIIGDGRARLIAAKRTHEAISPSDNVDSDLQRLRWLPAHPMAAAFAYCSDRLRFHMARITMALGDAANCRSIPAVLSPTRLSIPAWLSSEGSWTWSRTVQHWSSAVEWLAYPSVPKTCGALAERNERWLGGYKFVPNVRNMEFAITSWASPHEGRDTVIRFLRETKEDGPLTLDSLTFTLTLEPPLPHEIALFVSARSEANNTQVIRFRGFTSELLDMVMFEWMSIGCGLSVRTVIFVACEVDVERLDRFVKWKRRQNGWNEDVDAGTGLSWDSGFDSLVFHNTRLIRDWERNWFGNTYRVSVGTSELMEKSKEVRVVSKFSVIFKTMIRGGCRWENISFFGQMEDDSAT